jgi:hypothetical protein
MGDVFLPAGSRATGHLGSAHGGAEAELLKASDHDVTVTVPIMNGG